jgi:hypothetical protein
VCPPELLLWWPPELVLLECPPEVELELEPPHLIWPHEQLW